MSADGDQLELGRVFEALAKVRVDLAGLRAEVSGRRTEIDGRLRSLMQDLDRLERALTDAKMQIESEMSRRVTVDRHRPVELLVYGLAGLILTAVFVALLTLILRGHVG